MACDDLDSIEGYSSQATEAASKPTEAREPEATGIVSSPVDGVDAHIDRSLEQLMKNFSSALYQKLLWDATPRRFTEIVTEQEWNSFTTTTRRRWIEKTKQFYGKGDRTRDYGEVLKGGAVEFVVAALIRDMLREKKWQLQEMDILEAKPGRIEKFERGVAAFDGCNITFYNSVVDAIQRKNGTERNEVDMVLVQGQNAETILGFDFTANSIQLEKKTDNMLHRGNPLYCLRGPGGTKDTYGQHVGILLAVLEPDSTLAHNGEIFPLDPRLPYCFATYLPGSSLASKITAFMHRPERRRSFTEWRKHSRRIER